MSLRKKIVLNCLIAGGIVLVGKIAIAVMI